MPRKLVSYKFGPSLQTGKPSLNCTSWHPAYTRASPRSLPISPTPTSPICHDSRQIRRDIGEDVGVGVGVFRCLGAVYSLPLSSGRARTSLICVSVRLSCTLLVWFSSKIPRISNVQLYPGPKALGTNLEIWGRRPLVCRRRKAPI